VFSNAFFACFRKSRGQAVAKRAHEDRGPFTERTRQRSSTAGPVPHHQSRECGEFLRSTLPLVLRRWPVDNDCMSRRRVIGAEVQTDVSHLLNGQLSTSLSCWPTVRCMLIANLPDRRLLQADCSINRCRGVSIRLKCTRFHPGYCGRVMVTRKEVPSERLVIRGVTR